MRVDEKSAFVDDCLTFMATFTVFTTPEEDDDDNDDDQAEDLNSPAGFFIGVLKFVINVSKQPFIVKIFLLSTLSRYLNPPTKRSALEVASFWNVLYRSWQATADLVF